MKRMREWGVGGVGNGERPGPVAIPFSWKEVSEGKGAWLVQWQAALGLDHGAGHSKVLSSELDYEPLN